MEIYEQNLLCSIHTYKMFYQGVSLFQLTILTRPCPPPDLPKEMTEEEIAHLKVFLIFDLVLLGRRHRLVKKQ